MQDVISFLRIMGRWWWVTALVLLATTGALLTLIQIAKPRYRATVTIQISAPPPQEVPLFSEYGREAVSQQIEQTRTSLAEFLQVGDVAPRVLARLPQVTLTEQALSQQISVELPTASQSMIIRVEAADANTAALLANVVAEVSLAYYAEVLAQPTTNNRQFIEEQLKVIGSQLVEAETKLEQFRLQHKIYDVEKAIDEQSRLLTTLRQSGDLARTQNNQAELQQVSVLITERENELQTLIQLVPEYNTLVDQVEHVRATTNLLAERLSEAQIKESQILSNSSIHVLSVARPPRQPLPAVSNSVIIFSVMSSLIIGVLLTLLLEFIENLQVTRRRRLQRRPPEVVISPVSKMP